MKNQYVGDVNDYLKYGLLRCCAEVGWTVGVCWMLTPDDIRSDGGKVGYLADPSGWRNHDPILFDALATAVSGGNRDVERIEKLGIIPQATYFRETVPEFIEGRISWLNRALAKLQENDLLFFDPDNGLEIPSKPRGRRDSSKYLYWDEVELAWAAGASLLIFQHFARESRQAHISRLLSEFMERLPDSSVVPIGTPNVLFLSVWRANHARGIPHLLSLLNDRWETRMRFLGESPLVP